MNSPQNEKNLSFLIVFLNIANFKLIKLEKFEFFGDVGVQTSYTLTIHVCNKWPKMKFQK